MISFDKVNKPNLGYSLVYPYIHFMFSGIYLKHFHVINREKLPQDGEGYLVVCNHQNGLCDALGILHTIGGRRRPVFIARGDIFLKDKLAKILRFFRIMPAFRVRDGGKEHLGLNDVIFEESARIINEGDVVALFPEASHQHGHYLARFRKGFARIAFRTVEKSDFKSKLRIVPMAHHYSNYFSAQSDLVMVVGEPFEFTELYDIYKEDPNRALTLLCEKARERVQALMLDIADDEHYDNYWLLCKMGREDYLQKNGLRKGYFPNVLTADKAIAERIDYCKESDPEAFRNIIDKTGLYLKNLNKLKLRDWIFRKHPVLRLFWHFVISIVLFPFWLYGLLANIVPIAISRWMTSNKMKDRMLHSSVQFAIGAFLLPVWYLILFILLWVCIGCFWKAFLITITFFPSLIIYLNGQQFYLKRHHSLRFHQMFFHHKDMLRSIRDLRQEIVTLLNNLPDRIQ